MSATQLAERPDIHKSCKAVEVVVNLLNDYCDAVTAFAAIQKKLAKAIREASSVKNTSDIAANALNACATVVEALVEVDSKFTKLIDKECDTLSTEVKKWFKTLAKEERAHDARLATANGKIKQAGQVYERKVKKNPVNAAEEHARYINVLGTVGPEVSQEKYQHTVSVHQQHASILMKVAVSVCRIADAEWLRACEEVRRVSPTIGSVGEWKAFCEGGWTGKTPVDLPNIVDTVQADATGTTLKTKMSTANFHSNANGIVSPAMAATPAPEYASRAGTPADYSPSQPPHYFSPVKPVPEHRRTSEGEDTRDRSQSVNSIASLGSFPSPPTHFPIPPMPSSQVLYAAAPSISDDQDKTPMKETMVEPAAPAARTPDVNNATFLDFNSPPTSPSTTGYGDSERSPPQSLLASYEQKEKEKEPRVSMSSSSHSDKPPVSPGASSSTSSAMRASQVYKRGDYMGDTEFGVRKPIKADIEREDQRSPSPRTNLLERRDTNRSSGSGSVVSLARGFARSTGPSSPPPKDIPRLPLSVSNLATRYESTADVPGRRETRSPVEDRRRNSVDVQLQGKDAPAPPGGILPSPQSASSYSTAMSTPSDDDIARRRHRIRELEQLEFQEQEHELLMQEREIEVRSRDLERDRQRLFNTRGYRNDPPTLQQLQMNNSSSANLFESPATSPTSTSRHPYASSSTQLPPPMNHRFPSQQFSVSQPSSPMYAPPMSHADSCGCETCSIAKYTSPKRMPSSQNLRPPESPVPRPEKADKPKGWIRRLSMPVMGNAFASSDAKKGISNTNMAAMNNYRNSMITPDEDGRLRANVMDTPKNRSVTNLARR